MLSIAFETLRLCLVDQWRCCWLSVCNFKPKPNPLKIIAIRKGEGGFNNKKETETLLFQQRNQKNQKFAQEKTAEKQKKKNPKRNFEKNF